jgi:branched-chain amino acid transport system ATP-binding protein
MSLLEARGVSKSFGGIEAVKQIDVDADRGEIVGLVGPNGAGKTTFFNCLLGLERPDAGRVVFDGHRLDGLPVHRRVRLGIGRTFQRMELFAEMSVEDHLLVAERSRRGGGSLWRDLLNRGAPRPEERAHAAHLLEMLGIADLAQRPAESLTLGPGRLVELGRALALEPKLLMLDEPSSGLDRAETETLGTVLTGLVADRGVGMLLVEHDLDLVRQVTDRVYVMDFGRMLAEGPTDEVLGRDEVRAAYLGSHP